MTTPIAEFTRSQFMDFSKRGKPDYFLLRKSIPIEKFVKKEILAKNEKAVVVVGDFHLASNLSWFFKNHPDMKVHAVIRQHQYEFWEMPVGSPTYLVIDKRKLFGQMKRMAKYCSKTPDWQTDVISNSYEEKKIRWAKCD